jgi:hypothetical protein
MARRGVARWLAKLAVKLRRDMGNTYETDGVSGSDEIKMALQAAMAVKALGNMIGCHSWLQAALAMKDVEKRLDALKQTVATGRTLNTGRAAQEGA